jgi:hypothetical protein
MKIGELAVVDVATANGFLYSEIAHEHDMTLYPVSLGDIVIILARKSSEFYVLHPAHGPIWVYTWYFKECLL